jgi:Ca2+-binding EF-hand superfamily protein
MADPELRRTVMRLTATVIVAAALTAVAAVHADDSAKKYDPRAAFAETDRNHDGVVDHEEFQERLVEVFYSADTNKDGTLDVVELKQLTFPDDFKKDAAGHVTLREFLRVRFKDYDAVDKNHDGVLSVDEVVEAYETKKSR